MITRFVWQNAGVTRGLFVLGGAWFGRVKFPLPDLGEKIKEGTVRKLYVTEGQKIQEFQKIADVESDKQFTQITAPEMGTIAKIYYKEKEVCKVGDLFMEIDTEHGTGHAQPAVQNKQGVSKQPAPVTPSAHLNSSELQILASPVVRIFAMSKNVDLSKVTGSGRKGRILKEDIINYLENKSQPQSQPAQKQPQSQIPSPPPSSSFPSSMTKIRMNPFQKGMQKSMTSANQVPHLYYNETMDITQLQQMRGKLKTSGMKVTVMGILTKTFSLALKDHPKFNSSYRAESSQFQYTLHQGHNISLAMDTPNGLVVPHIRNVEKLSIVEVQGKLAELKTLADAAKLTRDHLEGGTICLSNIGTIAGISACPLVLVPQTCIVAIGKVVEVPIFMSTTIIKKKYMTMSFGCDHRVIDGASVARFSNSWKQILENPYIALAKMR